MLNKDDLLVSLRRTLVPMIVGLVAGSFLGGYVNPDALDEVVTGAVTAVYYLIVRLLESRFRYSVCFSARGSSLSISTRNDLAVRCRPGDGRFDRWSCHDHFSPVR